jgi:hypothetical protein
MVPCRLLRAYCRREFYGMGRLERIFESRRVGGHACSKYASKFNRVFIIVR